MTASAKATSQPLGDERARRRSLRGETNEAEQWAEERALTEEDEVSYPRERDHLVLARVLLARSDPERALRLLGRIDDLAASQARLGSLIRIRAVRSLALQSAGDHEDALALLAEALSLARPQRYIRVFADEGAPMAGLLRKLGTTNRTEAVARARELHLIP